MAALLSDQTGLGMAVEELLCLYEFCGQNVVLLRMSLRCVTCHRCDMGRSDCVRNFKTKDIASGRTTDR